MGGKMMGRRRRRRRREKEEVGGGVGGGTGRSESDGRTRERESTREAVHVVSLRESIFERLFGPSASVGYFLLVQFGGDAEERPDS